MTEPATQRSRSSLLPGMSQGLARRMLVWVLSISALMAVLATSVQLFFDYRRDVSDLETALDYIRENQLPGLADAAWNFNAASLQVQLDGIGQSHWVAGARVRYGPSQAAELSTGNIGPDTAGLVQFPLVRTAGERQIEVGRVYIAPNVQDLYDRTINRMAVVLATQAVKSFVISICILLLMAMMITRHLARIADFARSFEVDQPFQPLALQRRERDDELHVLTDCLNSAYQRLVAAHEFEVSHNERLGEEVAQRTAELRQAHAELERLAITDRLTGLVNRMGLDALFARELTRASRHQLPLCVIIADVDRFKSINDTWGHLGGDRVLQGIASLLAGNARSSDIVGRWGGEEFLLVCPDATLDAALQMAERIRSTIAAHDFHGIGQVTSSFGVASWQPGDDADSLVHRADAALYRAKQSGRNRVEVERLETCS